MPAKKDNPLKGAFRAPVPGTPPPADPADGKKAGDPPKAIDTAPVKAGEEKKAAEPPKTAPDPKATGTDPAKSGEEKKSAGLPKAAPDPKATSTDPAKTGEEKKAAEPPKAAPDPKATGTDPAKAGEEKKADEPPKDPNIRFVSISKIVPLPGTYVKDTPRADYKDLIDSIKKSGMEKPVILRQGEKGDYQLVNGNQICMLLLYYIITKNVEAGLLKGNENCVKTIVTTETIKRIADANNVKCYDCYTGFKWIANVMRELEGTMRYLGGGEESYGFLAETFVRDKDSIYANSLICECAAWAADQGLNLYEVLVDVYMKYGFSRERGVSVVRPGKSGAEEIVAMMKNFRENPPKSLGGSPLTCVKDYADLNCKDLKNGSVEKMDFPTTSIVLLFFTENGDKISIRPSGTEPKIKFYVEVREDLKNKEDYEATVAKAEEHIDQILADLGVK